MNMNKYERLNQQKKYRSEKSFSGKKRVAAYCRVSTEKEEQAQSFESQCDFFRCYIEQKKEWEFYKVFADEGIYGAFRVTDPGMYHGCAHIFWRFV